MTPKEFELHLDTHVKTLDKVIANDTKYHHELYGALRQLQILFNHGTETALLSEAKKEMLRTRFKTLKTLISPKSPLMDILAEIEGGLEKKPEPETVAPVAPHVPDPDSLTGQFEINETVTQSLRATLERLKSQK